MYQQTQNFLSPNRDVKYEATTNSVMTPISSTYKQFNYTSLVNERQSQSNPISLVLPFNTDSVELNIKVKFKDGGSQLLKNMDPPLYRSPWKNNYQENYILPSLSNQTPMQFMELPVYHNTEIHNSFTGNYSRTTSYKPSFNITEQQDNSKYESFEKEQPKEMRKTDSIDQQNPLFPKNISSGLRKTQSNTFYETKGSQQTLNKNKIGKPVASAFNTFRNPNNTQTNNLRYTSEQHPSNVDYGKISSRQLNNQHNILRNFQDNLYNSYKNSQIQQNNNKQIQPQISKRSSAVDQIGHKYTKSQQFYPINQDYQPVQYDYIPERSFQGNNQRPLSRISDRNSSTYFEQNKNNNINFTIRQEQEPRSSSLSKNNSQQPINFNETFRQTTSIVPPYQLQINQQQQQHQGSGIRYSSSSVRTHSVINRPSSIQHQSFEVREPSEFQGLVQFKRTSSINPREEIDFNTYRNNSQISNQPEIRPEIYNNPQLSSLSSPHLSTNNRQQSNESQLKYSQSNRPSLISNFGQIVDPLVSPRIQTNEFNFNNLPNTPTNPILNTNFQRPSKIMGSAYNSRRSSRSPERQIFHSRPLSQSIGRISFNTARCPYNKIATRKGISLTKYEKKLQQVWVPESIANRWDSMRM